MQVCVEEKIGLGRGLVSPFLPPAAPATIGGWLGTRVPSTGPFWGLDEQPWWRVLLPPDRGGPDVLIDRKISDMRKPLGPL